MVACITMQKMVTSIVRQKKDRPYNAKNGCQHYNAKKWTALNARNRCQHYNAKNEGPLMQNAVVLAQAIYYDQFTAPLPSVLHFFVLYIVL